MGGYEGRGINGGGGRREGNVAVGVGQGGMGGGRLLQVQEGDVLMSHCTHSAV